MGTKFVICEYDVPKIHNVTKQMSHTHTSSKDMESLNKERNWGLLRIGVGYIKVSWS